MRVLIVDDEPDFQEAIREALESEGHRTTCASNGREALEHLRMAADSTCVILLDLSMPIMDGCEFRKRQLDDDALAAIPVVLITADGNAREKAEKLAVQGYLAKPIRPTDLLSTVTGFCTPRH
jgi:CheY-like chemotaxis protein